MAIRTKPVKGGPIAVRPLINDDTPPDAVEEFTRLVASRRTGDYRQGKVHLAALLALGWRVFATEPRRTGGGR
jgi:hypothetical protein